MGVSLGVFAGALTPQRLQHIATIQLFPRLPLQRLAVVSTLDVLRIGCHSKS